jgi:hypothetical protein
MLNKKKKQNKNINAVNENGWKIKFKIFYYFSSFKVKKKVHFIIYISYTQNLHLLNFYCY